MDMKALTRLQRIAQSLKQFESERGPAIVQARAENATWEQVATALGMSRAGVINLYNNEISREEENMAEPCKVCGGRVHESRVEVDSSLSGERFYETVRRCLNPNCPSNVEASLGGDEV